MLAATYRAIRSLTSLDYGCPIHAWGDCDGLHPSARESLYLAGSGAAVGICYPASEWPAESTAESTAEVTL